MIETARNFCKRKKMLLHELVTCDDCGIVIPSGQAFVSDEGAIFVVLCENCKDELEAETNADQESLGNDWW